MKEIKNKFLVISIAVFILMTINPYYIWGYERVFYFFSFFFILILAFLNYPNVFLLSYKKIILSLLLFFFVFYYYSMFGASVLGSLLFSSWLLYLFLIRDDLIVKIFDAFKFVYSIVLIPSIILWIIHLFFDNNFFYLGSISEQIIPNQLKVEFGYGYAEFPFAIVADYMMGNTPYRLHGPFDEPGVIGTLSALMLAASRLSFRRKSDFIILISGVLSLSLAFYLIIFIYWFIVSFSSYKKMKYLVLSFFAIFVAAQLSNQIYNYTFDRVHITEKGISGDNRTNLVFDDYFNKWKASDESSLMFGLESFSEDGSSSWKVILLKTGLVGVLLFVVIISLYFLAFRYPAGFDIYFMAFSFVFLLSIYQRPYILTPYYMLIFSRGIMKNFEFNAKENVKL